MKLGSKLVAPMLLAMLAALSGCAKPAHNTAPRVLPAQASFATPEEAVSALIAAAERQDVGALHAILGRGTAELVSSGDPVADRQARDAFLSRYHARHELLADGPNDQVLLVGDDRWPFAIPLVRTAGRWFWDGAAGAPELVLRRIRANELRTVEVMRSFVSAQKTYAAVGHDGAPPGIYARKLRSSPGKQDGLYWESADGEPTSPADALLAQAAAEGYVVSGRGGTPYHGYLYRLLTSQGANAHGGARDYLASGKLTGGFAALAYPDSYGASGVMTFVVNQDGVVYQRDLGKDTAALAAAIKQFNPDDNWSRLQPGQEAAAGLQSSAPPIRGASRR
ncbi:MAG TPA: DUF2950 domain-containing protein [Steroidobacteraceae bacterium]|nr:DUF2950 domain-containing protein [Steroidobacteraceae bacterium]